MNLWQIKDLREEPACLDEVKLNDRLNSECRAQGY